ncbi:MAG: PSD1 and planctomycete cytochrome C domain-containing protein [Verrucomicrobiales bacterium]|nr:PSD1 and planctomycete cytochrome C domain-containing protein [Verrucomicrobiales bacterium]
MLSILLVSQAQAEQVIPADQLDYFETHVRPNLVKYCYECHSVEAGESRGGLYLDTREGMRAGGSTGPIFDDERWEYSLFVDAITWNDPDFEMPPKQKMPDEVIAVLTEWVKMGAPDPREREVFEVEDSHIDIEAGKQHWSYQKPVRPAGKSIDAIVSGMQKEQGLTRVGAADAMTLLRRVTFDITGLPPTPPEVTAFAKAFQKDRAAAVSEKLKQLLASDHYGERWGRHWLDVVRYGESSGTLNIVYPYAWRFRNYVIDSFNEDKPYDQLITEHLAGDLLPAETDQERQKNLIATGFLAVGPKKQNEKNREVFRMNLIDEQIDTVTRGFMATSVACARCHDHKFDPIPTTDYYAMAGIFRSTETLWGTVAGNQNHRTTELLELPIPDTHISSADEKALYAQKLADFEKAKEIFSAGKRNVRPDEGFDSKAHVRAKQKFMRLRDELKFINPDGTSKTFGMGAGEGHMENCEVLVSGDINKPAQEVDRGFLQVLSFQDMPTIPSDQSGRLQLAEWITSTNNPLTARVMVNRIWMHLTGTPIVETMDNFGTTGLPPGNQALLDFLAIRFMENGWSVKELVREIVLSDTYQLASTYDEGNYARDPANNTYWRATPRQLDAESLRDQMLLVSGMLDRTRPEGSMAQTAGDSRLGEGRRGDSTAQFNTALFEGRSLYLPILRDELPDELGLFDFPNPQGTIGQRAVTNVAPQSLHLMNSELVQRQARAMAEVLERNFDSPGDQVRNAFLLSYSRPASAAEISRGLQFLREFDPGDAPKIEPTAPVATQGKGKGGKGKAGKAGKGKGKGKGRGMSSTEEQPTAPSALEPEKPMTENQTKLAAFCQALMMSAEFRTIH